MQQLTIAPPPVRLAQVQELWVWLVVVCML